MPPILQPLNPRGSRTDERSVHIAGPILTLLACLSAAGVLGVLHCLASAARDARAHHDLQTRVKELRRLQLERLRELKEGVPKLRFPGQDAKAA
jgi:hypothetical protein